MRTHDLEDPRTLEGFRLWLEANCDQSNPNAKGESAKLYEDYKAYCYQQTIYYGNNKAFAAMLSDVAKRKHTSKGTIYVGIALKP